MPNRKKYLIISTNPNPLCIAAEIDIVRNKRKEGVVSAVNLNKVVLNVHPMENFRDKIYEFFDRKYSRFILPELNGFDYTRKIKLMKFSVPEIPKTIDQLRRYKIDYVNIGLAALSSAASFARCTSEYTSDYGVILKKTWLVAHKSYYAGLAISNLEIDEVCIFNGRHAISRPIAEVLQKKTKVTYYEFDNKETGYLLYDKNIHSFEVMASSIKNHVPNYQEGHNFFIKNISRNPSAYSFNFTGGQEIGLLPEFDGTKVIISFFTSSPDEYFAISEDNCLSEDFKNQFDVALFAANECKTNDAKLVIRLHPHLQKKHISWMHEWNFRLLENLGATIIYPGEKYDSYALLMRSLAIITCGSTMGIEAAYQNIPNGDVVGFINSRIGCAIDISSKSKFASFLKNPMLPKDAKEQALRYGSFVSTTTGNQISGLVKHEENYLFENRLLSPTKFFASNLKKLFKLIDVKKNHF